MLRTGQVRRGPVAGDAAALANASGVWPACGPAVWGAMAELDAREPAPEDAPVLDAGEPSVAPPESEAPASDRPDEIVRPKKLSYVLFAVLAAISAIADLASKAWAQAALTGYDPAAKGPKRITVIEGYFDFIYAQNPGGAWSMLRGLPEIVRRPFFLFVSAVAIVFIVSIYTRVDVRQRALRWGLPLALGGAIGNLVDRMRFGYVVDFIHFWVKLDGGEYHWPTFNVADVAIVVGVALMAVDLLFARRPEDAAEENSEEPPSTDASEGEPATRGSADPAAAGAPQPDRTEPPTPSSTGGLDVSSEGMGPEPEQ